MATQAQLMRAFNAGEAAHQVGKGPDDNPFPIDSDEAEMWDEGFGVAYDIATALEPVEDVGPADGEQYKCTDIAGHKFEWTGTAYGGDDKRWHGEGRSLCIYCGADGDA